MTLADSVISGERLALARLLTLVENGAPEGRAALSEMFARTGRAHLIGVTGAPGTGKSSLVNRLAYFYRHPPEGTAPRTVAVVAVDPSSPFTGGAILGDRVRMRDLSGDSGVFIRSMAARGSLGGLAHATSSLVQVFDAAGYEVILIETVGAGQAEVDIARLAHTTLVVEAPGLGDDIQAIKAGILEIADILVINKADRPGVENTERALRGMLQLGYSGGDRLGRIDRDESGHHAAQAGARAARHPGMRGDGTSTGDQKSGWTPPILRTVATEGVGIPELVTWIERHGEMLRSSGEWQRRERDRLETELDSLLRDSLVSRWRDTLPDHRYQEVLSRLAERQLSPHEAVEELIAGEER